MDEIEKKPEDITNPGLINEEFSKKQLEKLIAVFSPMPLIKYPYFVSLGRRNRKREIYYEEDAKNGTKVKWTVKSRDYLPGEMEFKVWCWILHKISETRKPLPPDFYIPYTLTEIAKYWNMPSTGKTISLIAKAIENLQSSSIHHWIREPDGKPQDLAYSLLAGRVGKGENKNETILNKNAIFLDPVLIKLLNEGPIKPSSLEKIKSLADANLIAARLYELLGWKFYFARTNGKKYISFTYSDLIKRIGLKQEQYESDAKRQFIKAHKHLKKEKIILNTPAWQNGNDRWEITYEPGENLITEIDEWVKKKNIKKFATQIKHSNSEIDYALEEITDYLGKNEKQIFQGLVRKIFENYPNGLQMIIKAISESKQEAAGMKIRNKAAYLTTILKKYAK